MARAREPPALRRDHVSYVNKKRGKKERRRQDEEGTSIIAAKLEKRRRFYVSTRQRVNECSGPATGTR
jgi:hypothetical protein